MLGALCPTHRFQSRERRIRLRKLVIVAHHLLDRCKDVVHILRVANQKKLREPQRLLIRRAFGNRAANVALHHPQWPIRQSLRQAGEDRLEAEPAIRPSARIEWPFQQQQNQVHLERFVLRPGAGGARAAGLDVDQRIESAAKF